MSSETTTPRELRGAERLRILTLEKKNARLEAQAAEASNNVAEASSKVAETLDKVDSLEIESQLRAEEIRAKDATIQALKTIFERADHPGASSDVNEFEKPAALNNKELDHFRNRLLHALQDVVPVIEDYVSLAVTRKKRLGSLIGRLGALAERYEARAQISKLEKYLQVDQDPVCVSQMQKLVAQDVFDAEESALLYTSLKGFIEENNGSFAKLGKLVNDVRRVFGATLTKEKSRATDDQGFTTTDRSKSSLSSQGPSLGSLMEEVDWRNYEPLTDKDNGIPASASQEEVDWRNYEPLPSPILTASRSYSEEDCSVPAEQKNEESTPGDKPTLSWLKHNDPQAWYATAWEESRRAEVASSSPEEDGWITESESPEEKGPIPESRSHSLSPGYGSPRFGPSYQPNSIHSSPSSHRDDDRRTTNTSANDHDQSDEPGELNKEQETPEDTELLKTEIERLQLEVRDLKDKAKVIQERDRKLEKLYADFLRWAPKTQQEGWHTHKVRKAYAACLKIVEALK